MKQWIIPEGVFEQGRAFILWTLICIDAAAAMPDSCQCRPGWRKLHDLVGFSGPRQIPGKLSGEALMKCAHSRVQQLLFERLIKPLSLWPIIATTPIGLL